MDHKVAETIRQQSNDLREELEDLHKWEKKILSTRHSCHSQQEHNKEGSVISAVEPPIRGTVPSIKSAMQSKEQELRVAQAKRNLTAKSESQMAKERGNQFFAERKYDKALEMYDVAIACSQEKNLLAVLHANKALCYLKMSNWSAAEEEATLSLNADKLFVKAYYRRAVAQKHMGNFSASRSDLDAVLALSPTDSDANHELTEVINLLQKERFQSAPIHTIRRKVVIEEVSSDDDDDDDDNLNVSSVKITSEENNVESITNTESVNDSSDDNVMKNSKNKNDQPEQEEEQKAKQNEVFNAEEQQTHSSAEKQVLHTVFDAEHNSIKINHESQFAMMNTQHDLPQKANLENKQNDFTESENVNKQKDEADFHAAVRDVEARRTAKTNLEWERLQARLRTSKRVEVIDDECCGADHNYENKEELEEWEEEELEKKKKQEEKERSCEADAQQCVNTNKNWNVCDIEKNSSLHNTKHVDNITIEDSKRAHNINCRTMIDNENLILKDEHPTNEEYTTQKDYDKYHNERVENCELNLKNCKDNEMKSSSEDAKAFQINQNDKVLQVKRTTSDEMKPEGAENKMRTVHSLDKTKLHCPKSFMEFERQISKFQGNEGFTAYYIQLIPAEQLQSFFGSNITSEILYTILNAISTFSPEQRGSYLYNLCKVRRVGEIVLFFSDVEKELIRKLIISLHDAQITAKEISFIKKKLNVI